MKQATVGYETYKRVDVETASQGKLIIMLFNGAIQRAEEAKRHMQNANFQGAHNNLVRAQEIIAELRGALNMTVGDVASNLDRIYEYIYHLLVQANVRKEVGPILECLNHMSQMRDTWHEAFEKLREEQDSITKAPSLNQHGNALINIQG